jgi:hypothetical protein
MANFDGHPMNGAGGYDADRDALVVRLSTGVEAKAAAARANGERGGRPAKRRKAAADVAQRKDVQR